MTKQMLVNNGLPEGLHFKDIHPGDVLLTRWDDSEDFLAVVVANYTADRKASFKGPAELRVAYLGSNGTYEQSIEPDQVVKRVCTIQEHLAALSAGLEV